MKQLIYILPSPAEECSLSLISSNLSGRADVVRGSAPVTCTDPRDPIGWRSFRSGFLLGIGQGHVIVTVV